MTNIAALKKFPVGARKLRSAILRLIGDFAEYRRVKESHSTALHPEMIQDFQIDNQLLTAVLRAAHEKAGQA